MSTTGPSYCIKAGTITASKKKIMRTLLIILAASFCIGLLPARRAFSRIVTPGEARTVAENYITAVIAGAGSWGGSPYATVGDLEELRRSGRLLGYWCHIQPHGYVVVSLSTELSPVKASSETWDGDPSCEFDIVDVIKWKIEQEHDYIEARVGAVLSAPEGAIAGLCEYSPGDSWALLGVEPGESSKNLSTQEALDDYQESMILLTTNWFQGDPYNLYMPPDAAACSESYGYRCAAGCTALGAAQIMKYWAWPPYGMGTPYDDYYYWTSMPDELTDSSPPEETAAVATLVAEVGLACDMDYCMDDGCTSGAFLEDMITAYLTCFRYYPTAYLAHRTDFSGDAWYAMIQNNINTNMPLQYEVPNHTLVCDGWRIVTSLRQYHMNYGWANAVPDKTCWAAYVGTGSNTWFVLDLLPCTDLISEKIIGSLHPAVSLNQTISGTYSAVPAFPWRYINVDAGGGTAVFEAGQLIQSLPEKKVVCTSTTGGAIKFYGTATQSTRLFTSGDTSRGVLISGGCLALYGGGGIFLH